MTQDTNPCALAFGVLRFYTVRMPGMSRKNYKKDSTAHRGMFHMCDLPNCILNSERNFCWTKRQNVIEMQIIVNRICAMCYDHCDNGHSTIIGERKPFLS